jgi:hypothetical protein
MPSKDADAQKSIVTRQAKAIKHKPKPAYSSGLSMYTANVNLNHFL